MSIIRQRYSLNCRATYRRKDKEPFDNTLGIFYFDLKYGTNKGSVTAGNTLVRDFNKDYSSELIDQEILGVGDATAVAFTSTLDFVPVKASTVIVSAGAVSGSDNGLGVIAGTGISGTIDYATGAISVTFTAAPAVGVNVVASYSYNMEGNTNIPTVNIDITLQEVRAKTRKLKALWSLTSRLFTW